MRYTRREVGKLALAASPAASLLARPSTLLAQARHWDAVCRPGGIEPARSLVITRSHTPGFACGAVTSIVSSARPAVLSRWLWHATQ